MQRRMEYDAYLRSDAWMARRRAALARAEGRCQVCNSHGKPSNPLDAHHRTYERFEEEAPGDLTILCRRCHDLFHGNKKKRGKRKPQSQKTTKPLRPCEACGEHLTSKGCCKKCRKRARQAPKTRRLPPVRREGMPRNIAENPPVEPPMRRIKS